MINVAPDYVRKPILILGCGNILFGDDGFGSAVARYIQEKLNVPSHVCVLDAGTGAGKILLTVAISELKPEKIIIIDAADFGRKPGEVFEVSIDDLAVMKPIFSLHHLPFKYLLKEICSSGNVEVKIIACQVEKVPEEVNPGLSEIVKEAIPKAARAALEIAGIQRISRKR